MSTMQFGDGISWDHHVDEILAQFTTRETLDHPYDPNYELAVKLAQHGGRSGRLLECGSHVGRWVSFFQKAGFDYTGVDQSAYALEMARRFHPEVTFYQSFLWDMDFQETFDVAAFIAVLQHNTHPEKERILPRVVKALKPGGVLILMESTVPVETKTQLTHDGWVQLAERHGLKLLDTWHENELGLPDAYAFRKV
jgi:SAM-dependent methyltransferase